MLEVRKANGEQLHYPPDNICSGLLRYIRETKPEIFNIYKSPGFQKTLAAKLNENETPSWD